MKPIGGPASGGPTGAACSVLRRETWQVRTRSTVYASIRVGFAFVLAGIVVGVLPAKGAAQAPTSPPPTPFFPWDDGATSLPQGEAAPSSSETVRPAAPPVVPPSQTDNGAPPPPPAFSRLEVLAATMKNARAGHLFVVRLRVGKDPAAPVTRGQVDCVARILGRRLGRSLKVRTHDFVRGWATCSWRVPRRAHGKRLKGSASAVIGGETARKMFTLRVRSRRAATRVPASSAAVGGGLRTGQLTCTLGDFFKTVYAWQPEVSAVNRTAGLDSETVWWVTQFYYSQDANILNGSAWFGDGWNQWFYTYADDSTWWPDAFTDYNTRTRHTGIAAFNTFDSYSVAAHNWVWYSSTGGWRDFWSSDGAGRPVTCGIQARLRPF